MSIFEHAKCRVTRRDDGRGMAASKRRPIGCLARPNETTQVAASAWESATWVSTRNSFSATQHQPATFLAPAVGLVVACVAVSFDFITAAGDVHPAPNGPTVLCTVYAHNRGNC
jgi:hypothetical protein